MVRRVSLAHSRGPFLGHSEGVSPILLSCKIEKNPRRECLRPTLRNFSILGGRRLRRGLSVIVEDDVVSRKARLWPWGLEAKTT